MRLLIVAILLFIGLGLLPFRTNGQNPIPKTEQEAIPAYAGIKEGKLPNGLTYYILKVDNTDKLLMCLVVKAGYNQEEEGQYELAHLLEHMPFVETKHLPNTREHFVSRGLKFGTDVTAHTEGNLTRYYVETPAKNESLVNDGYQFLRDCAGDHTLSQHKVDIERGAVLGELRRASGPALDASESHTPYLLAGIPYKYISAARRKANIKSFKREHLLSFYNKWYVANNEALIVVGDLNPEQVEIKIHELFSDLKSGANLPPQKNTANQTFAKGVNAGVFQQKELTGFSFEIHIKNQLNSLRTISDIQKNLIGRLYDILVSERLKHIERTYPGARITSEFHPRYSAIDVSFSNIFTSIKAQNIDDIMKMFEQAAIELERIKRYGFSETEIQNAKNKFLDQHSHEQSVDLKRTSSNLVDYFMEGTPVTDPKIMRDLTGNILQKTTPAEINEQIQKLLAEGAVTLLLDGLPSENIPSDKSLINIWEQTNRADISQHEEMIRNVYFDTLTIRKTLTAKSPYKVEALPQIGAQKVMLENGINIIFKELPPNPYDDQIHIMAISPGGLSSLPKSQQSAASIVPSLVWESGVGSINGSELRDILSSRNIILFPHISEFESGFYGTCEPQHLTTALETIHEFILKPKFDAAQLTSIVKRKTEELSYQEEIPFRMFYNTVAREMSIKPTDFNPNAKESLADVTLGSYQNIFNNIFSNSGNFTYVILGSFSTEEVRPKVIQYLSHLPKTHRPEKPVYLPPHIPHDKNIIVEAGDDPERGIVVVKIMNTYNYSNETNEMLSLFSILLKKHLTKTLRTELGGTYDVIVNLNETLEKNGIFTFTISFECSSSSSEQLINATINTIDKIKNKDWLSKELADAKLIATNILDSKKTEVSFWIPYFKNQVISDRPITSISDTKKVIENISIKTIYKLANTVFAKENISTFQLRAKPEANGN